MSDIHQMTTPLGEISLADALPYIDRLRAEVYRVRSERYAMSPKVPSRDCSRSHPHDSPCPDHDLLTQIARLENTVARIRAASMHPEFNSLQKIATINTILTQA